MTLRVRPEVDAAGSAVPLPYVTTSLGRTDAVPARDEWNLRMLSLSAPPTSTSAIRVYRDPKLPLTVLCTRVVTSKLTVDPALRPTFVVAQVSARSPPAEDQ